jgi:predicted PurR-regulated permease PerM
MLLNTEMSFGLFIDILVLLIIMLSVCFCFVVSITSAINNLSAKIGNITQKSHFVFHSHTDQINALACFYNLFEQTTKQQNPDENNQLFLINMMAGIIGRNIVRKDQKNEQEFVLQLTRMIITGKQTRAT